MKYLKFNANSSIKVILKEKGIEHIVRQHNQLMPFKHHISYKEYESRKDEFGYHTFQLWNFIDLFGNLGMNSCDYFFIDLIFDYKDFEPFEFVKP